MDVRNLVWRRDYSTSVAEEMDYLSLLFTVATCTKQFLQSCMHTDILTKIVFKINSLAVIFIIITFFY